MSSNCCTLPPTDLSVLTFDEKQKVGKMVHDLRKQGYDLKTAQSLAYQKVMGDSIPFKE